MTEQPWLARPEWAARVVPNVSRDSTFGVAVLSGLALAWNGFLAVIILVMKLTGGGPSGTMLYVVFAPFVLAGVFLLVMAISVTRRLIRYRSLALHLETLPGVVGGQLSGTIQSAEGLLQPGMSLRLSCWRRAVLRHSSDSMLWEHVEDIPPAGVMRTAHGASVPFRFDVPWECEPTGSDEGRIDWVVTVRSAGGSVAASFDVPVYRTAASSPEIRERTLRQPAVAPPPNSKLRVQHAADGALELHIPVPSWRWKWYVFTLVAAIVAVIVARQQLPRMVADGMPEMWVIGTYVGIAAGILFFLGIIQMGLFFAPRHLRVDRHALQMQYHSLLRGRRVVPVADVADFVVKYSDGTRKYDVDIQRVDGATDPWLMLTAVDKREAEWLAGELRRALPAVDKPAAT